MKKMSLIIILSFSVVLTGTILAQEAQEPVALIPEVLPELPAPGLKPGDFFYFFDEWGEIIEEFFTFRAEARVLLQTERILERIAEVKALLEAEGIDAPGLAVAQEKIQANMIKAVRTLEEQKARGIEVALLAKQLDKEFDARQSLLKEVFELTKEDLKAQEKMLRVQIRESRLAGDFERVGELGINLVNIRTQKDRIDIKKDFLEEILEAEEERIEIEMEAREKELETLAEEAEDLFGQREKDLEWAFKQKEKGLEFQGKVLEIQLRQAILAGDAALAEQIRAKLLDLKVQEEALKAEEDILEKSLEQEKGKLKIAVVMKERAAEQIEEVREKLLDVKEELVEIVEVPPAVSGLIDEAESKLALAEQAYVEEKYGWAFGQAMAAEMLARNAERVLEEKGETVEKLEELREKLEEADRAEEALKEAQRRIELASIEEKEELEKEAEEARKQYQERLKELERERKNLEQIRETKLRTIPCQADADCANLICPMVIGRDTPQCGPRRTCICGPRERLPVIPDDGERRPRRPGDDIVCLMVLTPAINPATGECRIFPDSCQVPVGWRRVRECPVSNDPRIPDNGQRIGTPCQTDRDCIGLICPMVVGGDTPQCNEERGICFCGPKWTVDYMPAPD